MAVWTEDYLIINKFSRPGYKLTKVRGVVVHWTANPGASDEGHQKYFDGEDGGGERYAGAHIFVDKDSATVLIPFNEVAYHANEKPCKIGSLKSSETYYEGGNANLTTIGVEMCVEKNGTIHSKTIDRTVQVVAELCKKFKLDVSDIYRHYDVTGKNCPAPWVEDYSEFKKFKNEVKKELEQKTVKPKPKSKLKTVEVLVPDLWIYNKPDWNAKLETVKKGEVFTVKKELTVKGAKMYELKSGLYITGNPKFVKLDK